MKKLFLFLVGAGIAFLSPAQHLIPVPAKIAVSPKGSYPICLTKSICISDSVLFPEAEELRRIIKKRSGYSTRITVSSPPFKQQISLGLDSTLTPREGYTLSITPKYIRISGKTRAGIFYGIQTLDQLLLGDGGQRQAATLNCLEIEDAPRYEFRALMLDPARHFIPVKEVKRFIDLMARYKFNTLQLHLTDDQGWRVEIKKYPELTRTGAFRNPAGGNQGPDNGFYTQEELRDLIDYAAARHIEIIPELDIPGHTVAAIHAYPSLGCQLPGNPPILFGETTNRTLCASSEQVYEFYANILHEIGLLFPSKYLHLGGDEAVIDQNWGQCPHCQKLMNALGYRESRELMGYFFGRIHQLVRQQGKEMMLWCELNNIRLPANEFLFPYPEGSVLFTWRMGLTPKTIELTGNAGIKLIASPGEHCYLDYPQYKGDLPEYRNWGMPLLPIEQAYRWDPGYGLPAEKQKHIIGVAGLLWGEALQDINRITYMAYPRAMALAEAGWSQMGNRNWNNFKINLLPHLSDLIHQGISFRVPFELYRPGSLPEEKERGKANRNGSRRNP